jgi:hypothetical protein
MNILEFFKNYPTEKHCKDKFKELRLKQGIKCKKCGCMNHFWKKKREQWECKQCSYRTTLRSGTVMERSRLPYQYWFIAMHLLTSTKKSFSAKEIQRQLGHNRYEPIWAMLHKIRAIMGIRDGFYTLKGNIELDEGFFETVPLTALEENESQKRGRGSSKQTVVLVCAEYENVTEEESEKYRIKSRLGYVKMNVIPSLKKSVISSIAAKQLKKGSSIKTDGSTSYVDLKKRYKHAPEVVTKEEASNSLPWVHVIISNAKRMLLDVHHRIDSDFLQNYLNEYLYKLNRRYLPCIFNNLLESAVRYRWNWLGEISG